MTLIWLTALVLMTCLMFIPYLYERVMRVGFVTAMGYADIIHRHPASWAQRCKAAHMNALEGLVIFVPLALLGLHQSIDMLLAVQIYFFARLVHYVAYAFAIPYLRTLAFFVMLVTIVELAVHLFCKLS